MRYLLTGGAGFIGSHVADALTAQGDSVVVLDDLSTGRLENLAHQLAVGRVVLVEGSVLDEGLVLELMREADACVHFASVVGVNLVVQRPIDTLLQNVRGADTVLSAAAALDTPALVMSTSEVYGKSSGEALREDADRMLGATWKSRWNYAISKSYAEALALGYHRELGVDNTVLRLFNTVGPRQSSAYGMVVPRLVRQALAGEDLTVYGDGFQTRCFTHVLDTVDAIVRVLSAPSTGGRVFNVGARDQTSILELAELVIERTGSNSGIRFVPYGDAYDEGFEELGRRRPDTTAFEEHTGWRACRSIDDAVDDVVLYERAAFAVNGAANGNGASNGNGNGNGNGHIGVPAQEARTRIAG
jgi:UDP-glucose 4-epimerase